MSDDYKRDNKELNEMLAKSPRIRNRPPKDCCEEGVPVSDRKKERLGNLVQWTTSDNKIFLPASKTIKKINCGFYEIKSCPSMGIYFQNIPVKTEGLVRFPQTNSHKVLQEIQKFWEREDIFKEYNLTYKRGILLYGPPGCHSINTQIIMYDNSLKKIQDIVVGDLVKGPDSKPRKVLELAKGKEEMYRIVLRQGNFFYVNANHILHLKKDEEIFDIALKDFIKKRNKEFRLIRFDGSEVFIKDIVYIGKDDYYGFNLDQDHLYMTEDKIIHHNSGKSCLIQLICQDVIEREGIVVKFGHASLFTEGMRILREIEEETPVVVLMEDLEETIRSHNESEILNLLDGIDSVNKVVYVATTNFPEELGPRIVNRPSRFDKRFKIGHPNAESREIYFRHLIKPEKIKEINLKRWIEETEAMSIAHLKELFIAVVILGDDYNEAIDTLRSMKEHISPREANDEDNSIGFLRR